MKTCTTGNGMTWGGGRDMQAMSSVDLSGLNHIQLTLKVDAKCTSKHKTNGDGT